LSTDPAAVRKTTFCFRATNVKGLDRRPEAVIEVA
jgi:hypothetical protein